MNPFPVKTWEEVEEHLKRKGFTPTSDVVPNGRYWRSKSRRHMVVPDHIDGMYPDYLWNDLVERVEAIVP